MNGTDPSSDQVVPDVDAAVGAAVSAVWQSLVTLPPPAPPPDGGWTCRTVGRFGCDSQQVGRPDGRSGAARLHRVHADGATPPPNGPVPPCIFVPGRFDRSQLYTSDPSRDVRLHLAGHGVEVYSVEHRRALDEALVPAESWRTRDYLTDLGTCLAAMGNRRAVLIGHSMGAFMAYLASILWPERIAGLAVLDGGLTNPTRGSRVELGDVARTVVGPAGVVEWERMSGSPAQLARLAEQAMAGQPQAESSLGRLLALPTRGRDGCLVGSTTEVDVIRVAGAYLRTMDGIWPRRQTLEARLIALSGPGLWPDLELGRLAAAGRPRVFAALGGAGGPDRLLRNRHSATRADPNAEVLEIPSYGHLDVLFGPGVSHQVFTPLLRWLEACPV